MRSVAAILFVTLVPALAIGQHHDMKMAGQPPVKLEKGLGSVHHAVTTRNREAQAFFDQGLAYVFGFNHDEAVRSFQKAAELDPKMAMAYWGIALARGSNYNWQATSDQLKEAFDNLQKALAAAPNTSAADRAYIAALSKRYSADPNADQAKLAAAYSGAMRELSKKYPNDMDAATLYAESMMNLRPWQLWTRDGQPAENTLEIVATLERVLKRSPNHPGANHYYIHAVEASPHPEKALASARRLMTLAPHAGHLVHMPAHVYIRTGDYINAAKSNVDAIKADEAFMKRFSGPNFYSMMYLEHNVHFLASASAMSGRYQDAITNARRVADDSMPMIPGMPQMQFYAMYPMVVMVRFHKWDEITALRAPPAEFKLLTAYWHFARGMAMAGKKDKDGVTRELAAFREAVKSVPVDLPMGNNQPPLYLGICDSLLAGQAAMTKGELDAGIALLKKAFDDSMTVNYNEPPDWDLPVAEFYGPALLRMKLYEDAEAAYRLELKHRPNNGRALLGLTEALNQAKKTNWARKTDAEFRRAWRDADTPMTVKDLYR
jgi:tetratricopeptide (TPR) repeat protein